MTDIIKLAYEQGQMQALADLGFDKEANIRNILRHPIRSIKASLGNPEEIKFFANKLRSATDADELAALAAAAKAKQVNQVADLADLNANIRAHLSKMSPQDLSMLSQGTYTMPKAIQDQYLRVHGTPFTPPPVQQVQQQVQQQAAPATRFDKAKDWMKANPIPTALGAGVLGAGGVYGVQKATEDNSFSGRLSRAFGG